MKHNKCLWEVRGTKEGKIEAISGGFVLLRTIGA